MTLLLALRQLSLFLLFAFLLGGVTSLLVDHWLSVLFPWSAA